MVSLVVSTRNRSELLKHCIDSLIDQSIPFDQYEIIIVDNDSSDDTAAVIKDYCSRYSNIKGLTETSLGVSAPRNTAMVAAKYDWLAFIDDDGWVEKDFVAETFNVISNYDFTCFGGWFVPWYRKPKAAWLRDEWFSYPKFLEQTGELSAKQDIPGGIFMIKKQALMDLGGFPTHLGMREGKIGYGEDNWVQLELRKKGLKIGFSPKLLLHHLVAEYKYDLSWHLKKFYNKAKDWQHIKGRLSFAQKLKNNLRGALMLVYLLLKNFPKLIIKKNYYFNNYIMDSLAFPLRMFGSAAA